MTQESENPAGTAPESVFEFRTELRRGHAAEPEPGPALRLHLDRGGSVVPSRLAWTGVDGAHSAVAFSDGCTGFLGVHRAPDGSVVGLQGRLVSRRGYPSLPAGVTAADVLTFDTHVHDGESADASEPAQPAEGAQPGDWRRAGRLRVLVDDGRGCALRDLEWREEGGAEASISFGPDRSGFLGYLRSPGAEPAGYRGFAVPARPVPAGDDLFRELEEFGRQALGVVDDLVGRLSGWLGGRGGGNGGGTPPRAA
jgi:hypothetical protein